MKTVYTNLFILAAFFFSSLGHANPISLAAQLSVVSQLPNSEHQCPSPTTVSCVEAACSRLDSFSCDHLDDIKKIGEACRQNYGGLCLEGVCDKLDSFECNDEDEVIAVAGVCSHVWGRRCIDFVCDQLGALNCDDLSEIKEVTEACRTLEEKPNL